MEFAQPLGSSVQQRTFLTLQPSWCRTVDMLNLKSPDDRLGNSLLDIVIIIAESKILRAISSLRLNSLVFSQSANAYCRFFLSFLAPDNLLYTFLFYFLLVSNIQLRIPLVQPLHHAFTIRLHRRNRGGSYSVLLQWVEQSTRIRPKHGSSATAVK